MLTAVFKASVEEVERHARRHLPDAVIVAVGRLAAIQSSRLDELDIPTILEIAEAYNLPLQGIVDRPPFAPPTGQRILALPAAPERGKR